MKTKMNKFKFKFFISAVLSSSAVFSMSADELIQCRVQVAVYESIAMTALNSPELPGTLNSKKARLKVSELIASYAAKNCVLKITELPKDFLKIILHMAGTKSTHGVCNDFRNINLNGVGCFLIELGRITENNLRKFQNVRSLRLLGPSYIEDVSILGKVQQLDLFDLECVEDVSKLKNVKKLLLRKLPRVRNVSVLENVEELGLDNCKNVKNVSALGKVKNLHLCCLPLVEDVSALGEVKKLRLCNLPLVVDVSALATVEDLELIAFDLKRINFVTIKGGWERSDFGIRKKKKGV